MPVSDLPKGLGAAIQMERLPEHRSRGKIQQIHSHEDQLLSLWTLECGSPILELGSLVSQAGVLGDPGRASGHLQAGGDLWGSCRGDHGETQRGRPLALNRGKLGYCSLKTQRGCFSALCFDLRDVTARRGLWTHLPSRVVFRGGQGTLVTSLLCFDSCFLRSRVFLPRLPRENGALSTAPPPQSPPSHGPRARLLCRWSGWGGCETSWQASGAVSAVGAQIQSQRAQSHPRGGPSCPFPLGARLLALFSRVLGTVLTLFLGLWGPKALSPEGPPLGHLPLGNVLGAQGVGTGGHFIPHCVDRRIEGDKLSNTQSRALRLWKGGR